ncbi:hypothetical protein JR316_0010631 [Psilocybe cubensis]|uniref:Uncharacterized protein n=1 Tax=Psilocybe cubensis TaxID=181762 RepID=A0ACB8GMU3_PSICU|nr:hypothetical protein JR316_0010631 [Psilocybe cubensis]KAH9476717.1 hypothetical protein JR316_0010631 [Psilocybe cubensis]
MGNLPYELWLHITSFLNDEEVWMMRSLNRTVRGIVLDRHFRKVCLSMLDVYSREYRSRFSRFSNSNISTRVRELHVCTVVPATSKIAKPASSREKILSFLSQSWRNIVKSDRDAVSETLQTFTELRHVVLKFDLIQAMDLSKTTRLLQNCLLPSTNHLNSLEMSFPIELIGKTIPPALLLPHLKSFTVTLFTHRSAAEAERLFTTTATTTLHFGIYNLGIYFSPAQMHLTTLIHLSVIIGDSKTTSTRGLLDQFDVPMPKLEDFLLRCQYDTSALASSSYQKSTLQSTHQQVSSLVSMKLRNVLHNREDFLTIFDPAVSYHKLKYLHMSLQILTPDMLDIFALHLHNLHGLYILVRFLKCRHKGNLIINEQEENEVSR